MGKPWDELSSAERLDAILLALHKIGAEGGSAATIAHVVGREHAIRYPRFSHHGKQLSTATRVTPGITALRRRGLIGLTRRPGGRTGTADSLTRLGYERVQRARTLAGCMKDEYRVLLECLRQIPMPEAERREARPVRVGGTEAKGDELMAGEGLLPKGAARWQLFSDEELGWLALGISVAEGEGLLPPHNEAASDEFLAFTKSLDDADENRAADDG